MDQSAPRPGTHDAIATNEYAMFGPWVDEVTCDDELPRLYRSYPVDYAAADLVLKVPRNIARRDARPDMDLYDHVVVLEPERLTVLSRVTGRRDPGVRERPVPGGAGPAYEVTTTALADVVAVHDVVNMLDASLTVHRADGSRVTLRYSGSARANVDRLVHLLRASLAGDEPGPTGRALLAAVAARGVPDQQVDVGVADLSLRSDYLAVARRSPQLRAWAWYGRRVVPPSGSGVRTAVRRLMHAVSPMTLHGAVVAGDERVLEVFGRHDWLVRGAAPVHSSSRLVVPLARLRGVQVEPDADYAGAERVTLLLGGGAVAFVVPSGSDAHVLALATSGAR